MAHLIGEVVYRGIFQKNLASPTTPGIPPNGHPLVTPPQPAEALLKDTHKKDAPYSLWILPGKASFSGLWVYKEDHTEARVLGALAKIAPQVLGIDAVAAAI